MNQKQWLIENNPRALLNSLPVFAPSVDAGERRLRLLAVGLCRLHPAEYFDIYLLNCLEAAERFADGLLDGDLLKEARQAAIYNQLPPRSTRHKHLELAVFHAASDQIRHNIFSTLINAVECLNDRDEALLRQGADLIREVYGDPWRRPRHPGIIRPEAIALAQTAYQDKDFSDLPVLADMLDEMGYDNVDLLLHLRGFSVCSGCVALGTKPMEAVGGMCTTCWGNGCIPLPCTHIRGCWALDVVLSKS